MQKTVESFIEQHKLSCGVPARYLDFVSETGELGKEILKSTNYGKCDFTVTETAVEELGDCLFSLLALCGEMGIEAEDALAYAIKKYENRFAAKGTVDSGR